MIVTDKVSQELLDLLYEIKELAVNQAPISLTSLLNSIELTGYTYYEDTDRKFPRIEVLSKYRNEHGCLDNICTLGIYFINSKEVMVYSCRWLHIDDLEYGIDDNGNLFHYKYRFIN